MDIFKAPTAIKRTYLQFFAALKHFGITYAFDTLGWEIFQHFSFYGKITEFFWNRKDKFIHRFLRKNFPDIIAEYQIRNEAGALFGEKSAKFRIWIFWWQGIESAPPLVQICFNRLMKYNPEIVQLIDRNNFLEWVNIPDYIIQKRESGAISMTHFSDILRVTLLATHGGLWLDITCFITQALPEFIKKEPLYSVKVKCFEQHLGDLYVAGSCYRDMLLFSFLRDIWFAYWKKNKVLIDYFFTNHIFSFAYKKFNRICDLYDHAPFSFQGNKRLVEYLNLPYDESVYNEIARTDWYQKLSYKRRWICKTSDDATTFYGHILNEIKGSDNE